MLTTPQKVYRLDIFTVSLSARGEFLSRVEETHALLRAQPGFIQDFLLEQPLAGVACKIVTLVEWENPAVIESAKSAVSALHERTKFSPPGFFERLGIVAELGTYRSVR